jgi:hypothetical protein
MQRKVGAAPHRGNANRPLKNQGKAKTIKAPTESAEQATKARKGQRRTAHNQIPPPKAKKPKTLLQPLPKAILRDSVQHTIILTHSDSAPNLDRRKQSTTPLDHHRQILPNMPTLPKKNRHNGHNRTPVGDKIPHGGGQIRLHQLKKRQQNRPSVGIRPASSPQLTGEPLKRLAPAHIPRAMPEQHHPMCSHDKGP